jgi:hypothetical protein
MPPNIASMAQTGCIIIKFKNVKALAIEQMENLEAGKSGLALACGAGIALSVLTGGIGALIFGPSTVGVCMAAALS